MSNKGMNRRHFLKASGGTAAGAAAAASGAVSFVAPFRIWANELGAFNEHEAMTLLMVTRHIFPHDSLGDSYYMGVVEALDADAAKDEATAKALKDGVADLDKAKGIKWLDLSSGYQFKVLQASQDGAVFQKAKGKAVVALYNNKLAWRHFGYEGEAFNHGGYIQRGFDDLGWLPNPPEKASPKAG